MSNVHTIVTTWGDMGMTREYDIARNQRRLDELYVQEEYEKIFIRPHTEKAYEEYEEFLSRPQEARNVTKLSDIPDFSVDPSERLFVPNDKWSDFDANSSVVNRYREQIWGYEEAVKEQYERQVRDIAAGNGYRWFYHNVDWR